MRQEWRGGSLKPPDLYEGGRRGGGEGWRVSSRVLLNQIKSNYTESGK